MTSSEKTTIELGTKPYSIDVTKVPYIQSYISFQSHSGQDTANLTHPEIPLFDAAYWGIENGFRQCFRKLGPDLEQYHTLCDTLDFLGVDVLKGHSIDSIFSGLKSGKPQFELEYKYHRQVRSSKSRARDCAFRLLFLILTAESEGIDGQKAYNAVYFVVSHRAIFKYATRKVVRAGYEERFCCSEKQRASLDRWPANEPGKDGRASDEDVTTEPSPSLEDFDSDYY